MLEAPLHASPIILNNPFFRSREFLLRCPHRAVGLPCYDLFFSLIKTVV